jgi:phage N-6-adenine-methyltransferase
MANSNQEIATPWEFFYAVQNHLRVLFEFDLAATINNSKCGLNFLSKGDDSLKAEWPAGKWLWLNPPFANIGKWVNKCVEQSELGKRIVTIWQLSGDLNQIPTWKNAGKIFIIHGRIWPEVRGCMLCVWDSLRENRYNKVSGLRWDKDRLTTLW